MTQLQPDRPSEITEPEANVAISILAIVCVGMPILVGLVAFVFWLFSSGGRKED